MSTPRVTVVMRSKNADFVIGQALAGLFSQDYRDFELLVIDSGSTDRTLELVRAYPHRLIQIKPEDYYPGRVLNLGAENSKSELLVFQNSDSVPLHTTALRRMVEAFDDPTVDAALGRQLPRPEADPWVRREYAESFPDAEQTPPWITLSMVLAAMRRTAWERHRFYDDAWGSEDTEWGHWARKNGLRIKYVKDALVMHSHNYTLKQLYGRRFIEGEADAFIYRQPEGIAKMLYRIAGSSARDVVACLREREWMELREIPGRRVVYHWAYLKGHRHGTRRIAEKNTDASVGQRTVLSRHESNR